MLSLVARDPCLFSEKDGDPRLDGGSNTKVGSNLIEPRDLHWCLKNLRSKKHWYSKDLRSKKQKSIGMEKLPKSRLRTKKPRPATAGGPHPPLSFNRSGLCSKTSIRKNSEIALSSFNKKSSSEQGPEYELVEALDCICFIQTLVYHFNFIARLKNESEAENELFFAQVEYSEDFIEDGKAGAIGCRLCCILGPSGIVTGLCGCKVCARRPVLIQHPQEDPATVQCVQGNGDCYVISEHAR